MAKTKAERYREKESRQFLETMYFHEARLSGFTYEQIASLASTHFGRPISARKVATRLNLYRTERIAEDREQLRQIEAGTEVIAGAIDDHRAHALGQDARELFAEAGGVSAVGHRLDRVVLGEEPAGPAEL